MAYLEVLTGDDPGRRVELVDDLRLGRNADNDLCLSGPLASRYHARIMRHGAHFVLKDLHSRNGTELQGTRVMPDAPYQLATGDVITIGDTSLRFHAPKDSNEEKPQVLDTAGQSTSSRPSKAVQPHTQQAQTQALRLFEEDTTDPVIVATRDATIDLRKVTTDLPLTPEESQQTYRRLQAICQMSAAFGTTTDLPAVLAMLLNCLFELYPGAERALVLLPLSDSMELVPVRARTRHDTPIQQDELALSRTIIQTVKTQKCAILSHDALADPRFEAQESIITLTIRSLMCAPLLVDDEFLGLIQLDARNNTQLFTADDLEVLTAVSAQAALAIKQAQLLVQLRTANTALTHEIAQRQKAEAELQATFHQTGRVLEAVPSILIVLDAQNTVIWWNMAAEQTLEIAANDIIGYPLHACATLWEIPALRQHLATYATKKEKVILEDFSIQASDGAKHILGLTIHPMSIHGESDHVLLYGTDITQRKQLELQLTQAQKLEAIGQLAAGIAHEINTPSQFVSDNLHFLQRAFGHLQKLFIHYDTLRDRLHQGQPPDPILQAITETSAAINLSFLKEQIPEAFAEAIEGTRRVAEIVQAMKAFSHPGIKEKTPIDLNQSILTALTVSRNEWKYAAEVQTDLAPDLPLVHCLPGEFNQVVLNLVINATHAIGDVIGDGSAGKGTITVRTHHDADWVTIEIADTGTGIPAAVQGQVFDPFFTTKEVGKGTGQGLAIAHNIIVNKHGGTLTFETVEGRGTTFFIRLPLLHHAPESPPSAFA